MSWKNTDDEVVSVLNKKHFVAEEGGKTRVYNEKWDRVLKRHYITASSFGDFRNLYLNKFVEIEKLNPKSRKPEIKFTEQGDYWLRHRDRREYDEIIFDPAAGEIDGVKNLWRGLAFEPNQTGSWSLLRDHIYKNVCDGNQEYFDFYLNWWANAVQNPGRQANVAVVLKGNRGTGKGTAIGYLAELFGQHYVYVVSSKQVTGNFNLHLRDAVILFSDEAVYAGDPAAESTLKGMITEPYLPIEGKGKDLIMAKNNLHIIMSTNNKWAAPAGLDERRFFILNVPDYVKQDTAYFNAIKLQMNNGGRGAMLYELLNRDISSFDVYSAPKTSGLLEQKLESLDSAHTWWYGKLNQGYIFDGIDWQVPVPSEAVYNDYINHCKDRNFKYRYTDSQFGVFIGSMNPEEWPKIPRLVPDEFFWESRLLDTKTKNKKHYAFGKLSVCRDIFDVKIGHNINWAIPMSSEGSFGLADPKSLEII